MADPQKTIATALRKNRDALAEALVESIRHWDKFSAEIGDSPIQLQEFVRREIIAFVDYLILYFERRDQNYHSLYIGEKLKQCYDARDDFQQAAERRLQITQSDYRILISTLAHHLSSYDLAVFAEELESLHATINGNAQRRSKVLLIGDCLHLDIVSFLYPPLKRGFVLDPTFATSKNPIELAAFLRSLNGTAFDLIFYSPFSYEFQLDYTRTMFVRSAYTRNQRLRKLAEDATAATKAVLNVLSEAFEAPIFVHNSANIRRHDKSFFERAKNLLTYRSRSYTRNIINQWLGSYLDQLNSVTYRHFFVLDETILLNEFSEDFLGSMFYNSDLQHPAEFGRALASFYERTILAQSMLDKKVIVCDLDNTLWDGIIGEGAVSHYEERQRILKDLRHRGLVLAINSKNDPKKVHWTGAVLGPEDFVTSQINWLPKVQNLQRIAQDLNLKTKDFLFIDDRADERAMVEEVLPEIQTLDAESQDIWRQLALLAQLLPEQGEADRTLAYKQRDDRNKFLEEEGQRELQQAELFAKLGLIVSIHSAEKKELKRVVELINRTNQFNMCGSRTTLRQVADWHTRPDHSIIVAETGDKFGGMGIVSVIVLEFRTASIEIPIFILSCRVFGYGVETCVLNYVKRLADQGSGRDYRRVVGRLTLTPHNEPCRRVYREHGFVEENGIWVYAGGLPIRDPEWLTVNANTLLSQVVS